VTNNNIGLGLLAAVLGILALLVFLRSRRLERLVTQRDAELSAATEQAASAKKHFDSEVARLNEQAKSAAAAAQTLVDQHIAELRAESERIRLHYSDEARKARESLSALLQKTTLELEAVRKYGPLVDAEAKARDELGEAIKVATALKVEARALIDGANAAADDERRQATSRANEIRHQAETLLAQATRDAGRLVAEATSKAEKIGGDAYVALREKESLEQALTAIRNVVDGYGDRYIIPTRSLLDDLAADFGHTEAGQALQLAREQTLRMVEHGQAAECEYAESKRRETAIRFVIDAFNGKTDAILTRTKHDNYGTLEQEIRDAYSLVNLNGDAFRKAQILPAFLEARLAELKWGVAAQALRAKEREEQRRIKEQIREEERARREYEKAMHDAQEEEEVIRNAMKRARAEVEHSTAEERAKYEAELAKLTEQLSEAEARNQRAISMAQQTRSGHVYVVSNSGSFGSETVKIGMTRRLEPFDRIKELGDASVPFEFDVHAMIYSDDAPTLEALLHAEFDDLRINKVNFRKEFFRVPLERIRGFVATKKLDASFTMLAEAREWRESQAIERMTPEERQKYHLQGEEREHSD
jgi:hypothetical protein